MRTIADIERMLPGEMLHDEHVVVCTRRVADALDVYDGTLPTSPSIGRIYRRHGYVNIVCPSAVDGWVDHVPHALHVV